MKMIDKMLLRKFEKKHNCVITLFYGIQNVSENKDMY